MHRHTHKHRQIYAQKMYVIPMPCMEYGIRSDNSICHRVDVELQKTQFSSIPFEIERNILTFVIEMVTPYMELLREPT